MKGGGLGRAFEQKTHCDGGVQISSFGSSQGETVQQKKVLMEACKFSSLKIAKEGRNIGKGERD